MSSATIENTPTASLPFYADTLKEMGCLKNNKKDRVREASLGQGAATQVVAGRDVAGVDDGGQE